MAHRARSSGVTARRRSRRSLAVLATPGSFSPVRSRVLIVDDVEDMRYLVRWSIERLEGFEVVAEAASGSEALELLSSVEVDLVVLDLGLPDVSGPALAAEIRRRWAGRIVVFTGSDADVEELASQVDGFVRKSGDMAPLLHLLANFRDLGPHAAALALAMDARAPAAARRFVHAHLLAWGCASAVDDAELVVSELVTNAVVHARSHPHLVLALDDRGVRIEVLDDSRRVPVLRQLDDHAESGRGMYLVDAFSAAWGVEVAERGKRVWVELPCARVDA